MELIQEITDLLAKYGVDTLSIVAIIFMSFVLKSFDRRDKFKPGYVVFPLISSITVVGVTEFVAKQPFDIVVVLSYAGIAALIYDVYASIRNARKKEK